MTSGRLKFYVDDTECPSPGTVGLNAIGGVFNCGLSGTKFKVMCTETCSPFFAINEIKLYKSSILSTKGTPYNFVNNVHLPDKYESDINKLFFDGSVSVR